MQPTTLSPNLMIDRVAAAYVLERLRLAVEGRRWSRETSAPETLPSDLQEDLFAAHELEMERTLQQLERSLSLTRRQRGKKRLASVQNALESYAERIETLARVTSDEAIRRFTVQ